MPIPERTLTSAEAEASGSATLVAVTVKRPERAGAVYRPAAEMVPPSSSSMDHSTAVFDVPVTVARNVCVPLGANMISIGETLMETPTTGCGPAARDTTVTAAVALCDESSSLVATTW